MAINQLKTGAFLSYLLIGLGAFLSVLYTPVMLRLLGQSEYGLYSLVASVVSYLGLFSFGFGSAYVRYFARFKARDDQQGLAGMNGMFFSVFSGLGLVAIMAGVLLVLNSDKVFGSELTVAELQRARTLLIIMIVNTAITFPGIVFNSYISAREKFIFQKSLLLVKTVLNPVFIVVVLLMGHGSVGMAVAVTILNFCIESINVWFCLKKAGMKISFMRFEPGLLRELFVFSSFIFLNLVVNQINWNVDRYIIGWFRGTVEVAIYSIAAQLNTYYLTFSTAISNVYIPRVNEMVAANSSNKELSSLFARIGRLQFLVLGLVIGLLIFFGKAFITLWAGPGYVRAYPMALLLMVPVTIPLIQNLGIEIQRAKNMHKFRSWVYLLIALANVLISIPLVKAYGGMGAATGTAIALIVGNVLIMNWYYHNKVGINIVFFAKRIVVLLPGLIIPAISGFLILKYFDLTLIPQFILLGFVFIVIYVLSVWFLVMNSYEKELISGPVLRIANLISRKNINK
jgi:O-antigen/teichoic acid export membrane protein